MTLSASSLAPAAGLAPAPADDGAVPLAPGGVEATGLPREFMLEHALRIMFRRGADTVSAACDAMRLSPALVSDLFGMLREDRLIVPLGQLHADMRAEMRFELTEAGRARASEALMRMDYAGPCPVTLDTFRQVVAAQSVGDHRIGRATLEAAFSNLVTPEGILDRLGPAVNSGRSILLYGPPGNGKSSYAHALAKAMEGGVHVPYALFIDGEVIQLFDPSVHRLMPDDDPWTPADLIQAEAPDLRFAHCIRPAVITGAELTTGMLDLRYNPVSRTYQAPIHLKAINGVLIVDDLGRQRETPQAFINRLIIPMEEGVDYFALQSGQSFQAPFDTLMIFSTNIPPAELLDAAGLRRIYYKLLIERPGRDDFIKIFLRVCQRRGVEGAEVALAYVLGELYARHDIDFAAYHAVYLIDQAIAACDYHGIPRGLLPEFLDAAWANLSVIDSA
ncbi:MAG: ATPase [Pseudomonadota bacterium]